MRIELREEAVTVRSLLDYLQVPISFEVTEVLEVDAPSGGMGGLRLNPRREEPPWTKDYDALDDHEPERWVQQFRDASKLTLLGAFCGSERIGGALVVVDTPTIEMLRKRRDLSVLWDLRVAPAWRRRGVGSLLFGAAEAWSVSRGARMMLIETQNINVPACRFYARMGCTLGTIDRHAYSKLSGECQLLWWKRLHAKQPGETEHAEASSAE